MYDDGFGNLYHPECSAISCRDIPRDLEYNNRKLVHHNHQGRRAATKNGRLILYRDVGIDGFSIKKPRIGSPTNKKIRTRCTPSNPDVIHEECLPSFPGWKGLVGNLSKRLGDVSYLNQLEEIKVLWKDWTRECAKSYLRKEEVKIPYNGQAPWKDNIIRNTEKISDQLRLNTKIITMFFEKFRDRCLVDCSFLLSENGRGVSELEKQLHDFVVQTKKILNFEWPMAVAHLMLDEGASWIPLLVSGTSHTIFNAVAATMARLLYDTILENITRVKNFFDNSDSAKLIIVLEEGDEEFDYWKRINVLLELSKIPRVDHKIYPRMFTEAWIDIRSWFDSQSIIFTPLPKPFQETHPRIFEIEVMIKTYEQNPGEVNKWEEIAKEIIDVRSSILRKRTRTPQGFIIHDSSGIKQRELERVTELEEKAKSILLDYLAHKNNEIRSVFSLCSTKLFRNDVLIQLRNIEEVQNELPNIRQKIQTVHDSYAVFMNHFVMPDYDIRQYYEISRLGHKLEQLVNFVWDRIHHERQWITKQVSEQTSKNYYECEMIEKEWLDCLKKYRSAVRVNEVQKVQIKMHNLSERSAVLKERDENLIGQRSLLGLPSSPIDCVRIANVCHFFSRLSTLHYKTLLHHEACLRMRISDVDHAQLVAETEKLQAEASDIEIEAERIQEHVTTSKEALVKIQNVLVEFEKLLPVLGAISCQAMKDRHWQQILEGSETSVKVEGNPLVSELLEMNFIEQAEKFEQVGAQAEKERVLEKSIENMREQWKSATFVTHHAGDLLTTELNVQMQAHLARSQTILSSPFAFSILDHIRHWLDTLLNLNTFVQLYKQCDSRWKKIEGVFSTEDIAYQMPHEFRTFKKISLRWLHINNQITEERPILEQMDLVKNLNTELSELEILFGKMENGFHAYLRKKRAVFPRLFGLSDELVLSLICDSREPSSCKSYIPLLFPSLISFDQNTKMEIVSVTTKSETINLIKPVNVNLSKRHVEKWMHELDIQIRHTIKNRIRLLIEKMNYKLNPVETILNEPIQVAIMYLKIAMTYQIENAMKQNSLTILLSDLKICIRECQHCIIHKLPRRHFLSPIYHIFKHFTNLINKFSSEQVIYIDDAKWISHLRYYWHMESVFIRVGTVSVRYDYEIQDYEDYKDYHAIDDGLRKFIFMNHFGFSGTIQELDFKISRSVAVALGRPFLICDGTNEIECKMLMDGALLYGAVVFMKGPIASDLGKNLERDVYSAHNLANLKYHFETEITINTSFMFLLTNSFATSRQLAIEPVSFHKAIDCSFFLNSISHREKLSHKFQIISEFENYGGYTNLFLNYLPATITDIVVKNESVDQNLMVEQAIFDNFTVCMDEKHRKLMGKLLKIPPDLIETQEKPHHNHRSSSKSVEKFKTTIEEDHDPSFIKRKCKELIHLLSDHHVVVVCGPSLAGKSWLIRKAAKQQSVEVHLEHGQWKELMTYGERNKENQRRNTWIVIDGWMDESTKMWLYRLTNQNTLFPQRDHPIISTKERVIIEMDHVENDLRHLPMVYLDDVAGHYNGDDCLEENEKSKIDDIFEYYSEVKNRKLEVIQKIQSIRKATTLKDQDLFNHVYKSCLLTIIPIQQLMGFIFKKNQSLLEFYGTVPSIKNWIKSDDSVKIENFYIIHTISLILHSDMIPILVSPNSAEFLSFLAFLRQELDSIGWHPITLSVDSETSVDEIKNYVSNCAVMFGGHEVTEVDDRPEGANFFLVRGIEHGRPEVVDWIRNSFERNKIMKILLISVKDIDSPCYSDRFRRYLFKVDWVNISGEETTPFPLAVYNSVLNNITKDIKVKDVRDSITNQMIDAMSDASILNIYEKIAELRTPGEFRIVRGKGFVELVELRGVYQNLIDEKGRLEKRARRDPIMISSYDAKNTNFIEKVTQAPYGHMLIVADDESKVLDALAISSELNKQSVYTNLTVKNSKSWFKQITKVLRECLLDGKETVVAVKISSIDSSELTKSIIADVKSICCYNMVPPRYLSRLLLSEFGEKHTLEGKGIWEMLENKLSAFKVVIILIGPATFKWFMETHLELLSVLILNWWGSQSKKELEQEMIDEMDRSELFSKVQTGQIITIIQKLEEDGVLPSSFQKMKLLSTIIVLARKKKEEVKRIMMKYEKGMEKMKRAEEQVAGMQGELLRLQPQLMRTSIETSMLMSTIEKETIEVENAREVVAANENKANEAATKAQSLKAESEAELASAIPALEAAVDALETMTQSDVSSLKTMRFPPFAVRLCMEAVCILLGVKPAKVTNDIGEIVSDYWVSGQKLLSDIHFLAKIRAFPRDQTSKRTMKLIRDKYLSKEEFDPEKVKQCSLAAEGLCRWVLAIDMYNQISKIVEPKRERLRKSEVLVKQHLKQLEVKRKALLKVTEKLQGLSDQFSQMCQKKQELESQIASCEVRMERAERLVQALGGEKDKWQSKITDILHEDSLCVPYSVGSTLALHVFAKYPINERELELRQTLRKLFPKLEITIPSDLKTLIQLVDNPMCFVNDDGRALQVLNHEFSKVVTSNQWSQTEKQECLKEKTVLLLDYSGKNDFEKDMENAEYFRNPQNLEEIIIKISQTEYEVNKTFRIFFRTSKSLAKNLNHSIIINNKYSENELRREVCEKMGLANWSDTLNHYNEMVEQKENDIKLLDKTEDEMLDLLGRSKDLDDERAIDLLAEARNLQAAVLARGKEIAEIEKSLRVIEQKLESSIDWAMKVVTMLHLLHKFDSFYRLSLKSLIDVLFVKLFDNLSSIDHIEVNMNISKLYWKFIQHMLAWKDKQIVFHLLFHGMNYKVDRLEMNQSERTNCDSFVNFTQFVLRTSSQQMILLKYDSESYASLLQFGQVTKNCNWKVYSILENVILKYEKLTDEPCWLLINLNRSDHNTISQLKDLMDKISNLKTVHPSFRLILGYSTEIECSDELILLSSRRFYFSAPASLSQIIRRLLGNHSLRQVFDKAEELQRNQIIRLIAFHYGLKIRKQIDPAFEIVVDDADLLAMFKLFQELRNLNEQPNAVQDTAKIRASVIEPIYQTKSRKIVEQNVVSGMIQWIFEGNLSTMADTLLKKIIKDGTSNIEDFGHFIQSHDDTILCGFNARISRDIQNQITRRNIIRMRSLFEPEFDRNEILKLASSKVRSYLENVDNGTDKLDGRNISNLTELVSCLKIKFALKYNIAVSEVQVTAQLMEKESEIEKDEGNPAILIHHCILTSAHLEHGEIKEPHSRQDQFVTINLKTSKKTGESNPRSFYLICPSTSKSVANVPINSQFPICHWHLRGAHITVGKTGNTKNQD